MTKKIQITPTERKELEFRARSRRVRPSHRRRARLILMLANGTSHAKIQATLRCDATFITLWARRFEACRLAGLWPRPAGGQVKALTPEMEARILSLIRCKPPRGSESWSLRTLAKVLNVNHMLVARAWDRAGIAPSSSKRYMLSRDPDFARRTADIIGIFLGPDSQAAVFWTEAPSPLYLLKPHSLDSLVKHRGHPRGALALREALETRRLQVEKAVRRSEGPTCARFLDALLEQSPGNGETHVVAQGFSVKTRAVAAFRNKHPEVHLHLSATFSQWLNQVETVFWKIERDFFEGGSRAEAGLGSSLMRYLRLYCKESRFITWNVPIQGERSFPAGLDGRKLATRRLGAPSA